MLVLVLYCSSRSTVPAVFDGMEQFKLDRDTLFDVLTGCRVV